MMEKAISAPVAARDRDHRDQRVLEGMAKVDRAVGDAARPRELDVIGAQHLEHLGSHEAHEQRQLEQRERERA
jgi:hypothetical protein